MLLLGFPDRASGKEPAYQFRRYKKMRILSWKIPWRGHGNTSSVLFLFSISLQNFAVFAIKAQHESAISIHIGPPF